MNVYPEYQATGEDWLGRSPQHWQRVTLRGLAKVVSEKGRPDLPLLSVYRDYGVILRKEDDENHNVIPEDLSNYKVVHPGYLVLNKMKTWQGSLGVSDYEGIVSPAYITCALRTGYNPRFIHYLLRCNHYVFAWRRLSYGVRCDQWDMRFSDFKQVPVFLPPRQEQDAIVAFLEAREAEIQKFIGNQQRQIELLREHKAVIINQIVTRGLKRNGALKASGLPWADRIPENWSVCAVKHTARHGTNTFTDGDWIELPFITKVGVRLIQTGNVGIGFYKEQGFRYISEETLKQFCCTEIQPGDVLICRLDGPVGRACLTPELPTRMITSVDNTILKVHSQIDPRYIVFLMSSKGWLNWIEGFCRSGGSFRYRISRSMLGQMRIPLPPPSEQRAIADQLNREMADVQCVEANLESVIEKMEEYSTALISAAVTGKIDVRDM
jgi:type I restriction enzyme S subunit